MDPSELDRLYEEHWRLEQELYCGRDRLYELSQRAQQAAARGEDVTALLAAMERVWVLMAGSAAAQAASERALAAAGVCLDPQPTAGSGGATEEEDC